MNVSSGSGSPRLPQSEGRNMVVVVVLVVVVFLAPITRMLVSASFSLWLQMLQMLVWSVCLCVSRDHQLCKNG